MYVYSGGFRQGLCGTPTGFKDMYDKPLFVGDIVVNFTISNGVFESLGGMTVVVSDKYTSYTDGTHTEKDGQEEFYVMGIKTAWPETDDAEETDWRKKRWAVLKVKDHADVVDGEHWRGFGFNYKND